MPGPAVRADTGWLVVCRWLFRARVFTPGVAAVADDLTPAGHLPDSDCRERHPPLVAVKVVVACLAGRHACCRRECVGCDPELLGLREELNTWSGLRLNQPVGACRLHGPSVVCVDWPLNVLPSLEVLDVPGAGLCVRLSAGFGVPVDQPAGPVGVNFGYGSGSDFVGVERVVNLGCLVPVIDVQVGRGVFLGEIPSP